MPVSLELKQRLESVLEMLYLIFNEGYSATAGNDCVRPALREDAMRLGRVLAELMPLEPEVHGLVGLMEIQASRLRARVYANGDPILLLDQDRGRWDRLLIRRGLAAIARANNLGESPGPYLMQAEIAACQARASVASGTDWKRMADLYAALVTTVSSPVIELARAVAVGMAYGPSAGLNIVDRLAVAGSLENYHRLPSVRGDLLFKLGRHQEASAEFQRAADMAQNYRERDMLLARVAECIS